MGKQGYYGKEYVKDKNGDYDYQGQVNRLHNLKQWDRDETLVIASQTPLSIDEMQDRYKAYDWLLADDKHFENTILTHIDNKKMKKRNHELWVKQQKEKATPVYTTIHSSVISRIAHSTEW